LVSSTLVFVECESERRTVIEMKAIVIDGAGGPEVLKIKEVPDPKAGEGEVVVKVVAAALNRADVMQRQGNYPPPAGASLIPGLECSGTIESVGHGVTHWKVGDEVISYLLSLSTNAISHSAIALGFRFQSSFSIVNSPL
jgi:NADPH:quinone reductase-like Zn-dependent oxidoreductase